MTSAPRRPGTRRLDTHVSPRALTLAASIAWRHVAADPVRAVVLAQRVLPPPLRGCLRLAGPYGRAAAAWGAGDRDRGAGRAGRLAPSAGRVQPGRGPARGRSRRRAAAARDGSRPPGAGRPPGLARRPPHRRRRSARPGAWPPRPPPAHQPHRRAGRPGAPRPGRFHDRGQFWPDSVHFWPRSWPPEPRPGRPPEQPVDQPGRPPEPRPGPEAASSTWSTTRCPPRAPAYTIRTHEIVLAQQASRPGPARGDQDRLPRDPGRAGRPAPGHAGRHPVPPPAAVAPARPRRRGRRRGPGHGRPAHRADSSRVSCTPRATTPTR